MFGVCKLLFESGNFLKGWLRTRISRFFIDESKEEGQYNKEDKQDTLI